MISLDKDCIIKMNHHHDISLCDITKNSVNCDKWFSFHQLEEALDAVGALHVRCPPPMQMWIIWKNI